MKALPCQAMSKAVPWSTDVRMMGSPSVTLTPCLVVVHAHDGVVTAPMHGLVEDRIGRVRA